MTQGDLFGQKTLATARAELHSKLNDGVRCPCCDQFAKRYKRKLSSSMAAGLIWIVGRHASVGDWIDVPATAPKWLVKTAGDFSKLAHWDFIRARPNDDTKKRCSGQWQPTIHGRDFAKGLVSAAKHIYIYNNEITGFSEERVTIREALGDRFDYAELMAGRAA